MPAGREAQGQAFFCSSSNSRCREAVMTAAGSPDMVRRFCWWRYRGSGVTLPLERLAVR